MSGDASPLGRFDSTSPGTSESVTVELRNVPVAVLAASREHHDGLMREFRLMALSGVVSKQAAPSRLVELVQVLGVQYAGTSDRPDEVIDIAIDRGEAVVDLTYIVPSGVAEAGRALDALMNEADGFCRSEQLLTLARPPLLVKFAAWYLRCFIDQVAGAGPAPWHGPLTVEQ